MQWASHAVRGTAIDEILDAALDVVGRGLPDGRADVAYLFLSAEHVSHAEEALARIRMALGSPWVSGCGAGGVIGGRREYEQAPAAALLAGVLPGAAVHGFHLTDADLPDADAPPKAWHEAVGVSSVDEPSFVIIADPFSTPTEKLLAGLDFAYPNAVKVGGLASAARRPGEQILFHGDRVVREGVVGTVLMGDVELVPAVAQGCRAIGEPMRITACDGRLLGGLDDRPVLEALQELLSHESETVRELARRALFLGFEMDPLEQAAERPWLIRNLLGVDPDSRGVFVGEHLRKGRRVRFFVRDRDTSAEDLGRTLATADLLDAGAPEAALLFSCMGRGRLLYGTPDHDARVFEDHFADVPLGGFFCSGEIGPIGKWTYVHGYTSSFGLIRPRSSRA